MTHVRLATTTLNEAPTLSALAQGCKELGIDSWIIFDDEDSTDGTEEIAYDVFDWIPGKVVKGKFEHLYQKRNRLLSLPETREGADYLFMPQSDEPPVGTLDKDSLTGPVYMAIVEDRESPTSGYPMEWDMPLIVRADLKMHWEGAVHELLVFDEDVIAERLSSFVIHRSGSHASIEEREEQSRSLEAEFAKDGNPRSAFYLGQTYQALGRDEDAIRMYLHRASMTNGYDQERYVAMYRVGQMFESKNLIKAVRPYLDAWGLRPHRKEPLFRLAHLANFMGNHEMALAFCNQALAAPDTQDSMFVERWIERWGIAFQWSIAALQLEMPEAYEVIDWLLKRDDIPPERRKMLEEQRSQRDVSQRDEKE